MKTPLLLAAACLFVLGLASASAQSDSGRLAGEMTVNAEVQDQFFARYPDLAEERDVVSEAARQIVAQGREPADREVAAEALATQARALLSRRTPQEWQQKAVSLYPELGVANSEFNQLFLQRYQEMKRASPQFEQEPSWPVLLAKRCADELQARAAPIVAATPVGETPAPPATAATVSAPKPRQSFWRSALSIVLLAGILWLPARWLFRVCRKFAGGEVPVTLWQKALRPAAWTYLAVALIALFRTFQANADLGFIDRFGITLLVSLLAGAFFAPIGFAIALGVMWWQRRAAARAELMPAAEAPARRPLAREPVAK